MQAWVGDVRAIGKTASSFSMHVMAGGRFPSQMPVYRLQKGLKITSSSKRGGFGDTGQRAREVGPNDPCQDKAL